MSNTDFEFPNAEQYASMVFDDGGDLTVNLADVKELKFENIPRGSYLAEVDSANFGMSQNSGAPMIEYKFKIIEGEYAGRKLPPFYCSFSPKALPGTKANIMRLAPELIAQPFKPEVLCNQGYFNGRKVRIRVDHEEYQGEKRSKVKSIQAVTNGAGGAGDAFFNR